MSVVADSVAAIQDLREAFPLRHSLDPERVGLLAQVADNLPPVLVHRPTGKVVDGRHRIAAAESVGHDTMPVVYMDGSEEDAEIAALRINAKDGLPLELRDRVSAAERLLATHGHRSDRWIATVCAVSPRTVGSIRRRRNDSASSEDGGASDARIGRDGRRRPLSAAEGRRAAAEIMRAQPTVSLRRVAQLAGISVGTALDVRRRMAAGVSPEAGTPTPHVPADGEAEGDDRRRLGRPNEPARAGTPEELRAMLERVARDPSLQYTDHGRALLRLIATTLAFDESSDRLSATVPAYSRESMVQIAETCAAAWMEFGQQVGKKPERTMSEAG